MTQILILPLQTSGILRPFEKEVVLDPFTGSGTTYIAALKTKRYYVGYDNLKEYVHLAKRRIKLFLQEQLTLFNDSKTYSK